MRNINKIYAYKHNGDFHRVSQKVELLKETKDYFIIKNKKGNEVYESKNYRWRTREDAIFYFSKHHWFNIILMYKKDSIVYYCNLATPPIYEHESVKYIDYELDVKYYTQDKVVKVLDQKEYEINQKKFGYSDKLMEQIESELKILKKWIKLEIGPFSKEFREKYKEEAYGKK